MSANRDPVHDAIDRWRSKGMLDEVLADRLRDEVDEVSAGESRRAAQYVLAAAAAVVLLIAAGVFLQWAWSRMELTTQVGVLVGLGAGLHLWGARVGGSFAWTPAGYLMQIAGLALVLMALPYSESAWPDRSLPAVLLGGGGLLFALGMAVRSLPRDPVMPAAHLVFGLVFLGFFLERSLGMGEEGVVWTLDAVLAGLLALLVSVLRREGEDAHPWALGALLAALYAGMVLVGWTTMGIFEWERGAVLAMDAWFAMALGLNLWGLHRAPPGLRRGWFGRHLGLLMLYWIPLGYWTAHELVGDAVDGGLVLVAGAAVAGFVHAARHGLHDLMRVSTLAFIVVVWVWAVDKGGALGAVVALALTGVLLFLLSGRAGGGTRANGVDREASSGPPSA